MRIVERTPEFLKLDEPSPEGLRRSFIAAGVFFTVPALAAVAVFRTPVAIVFAASNLVLVWVVIYAVYAFARRRFRSKTTCTFDRHRRELTIERAGRPAEVYPLDAVTDLEIESRWTGRSASYRTVLRLGRDRKVPLSEAYLPGGTAFLVSAQAVREVVGLSSEGEPTSGDAPARPRGPQSERPSTARCRYCETVSSDLARLRLEAVSPGGVAEEVYVDRCARCTRIHDRHERIGPVLGLFLGAGVAVAVYFALVFDEAKGPVRNIAFALLFLLLMFALAAGGVLLARALLDPRRHGSRPRGDWSDFPEIMELRRNGWKVAEPQQPGIGMGID